MERVKRENGGLPLIIICHSYGCPFVHYFLTEKLERGWKQRHIRGLIGVAGAWAGHFHAFYKYLTDEPYDLLSGLVPAMRPIERTWSSNLFLLPRLKLWGQQVLLRTRLTNYSARHMHHILRTSNYANPHFLHQVHSLSDAGDSFPAPGIDVHCISGKGIATKAALVLDSDEWDAGRAAASKQVDFADGDGCVLLHSQRACRLWKEETEAEGRRFRYTELENLSHMELVQTEAGMTAVRRAIADMSGTAHHTNT